MQTGRFVCARVCMFERVCVSALVSVCVNLYLVCMLCAYIDAYRGGRWGGEILFVLVYDCTFASMLMFLSSIYDHSYALTCKPMC